MHEFALVVGMLDLAERHARDDGATRITALWVDVGALAGVVPEALTFAFEGARVGTLAHDAELHVNFLPGIAYCASCAATFPLDDRYGIAVCPTCDTPSADLRQGRELHLSRLEVV
jgi:hydrogenase nickel incorporation protein HypA/HybF